MPPTTISDPNAKPVCPSLVWNGAVWAGRLGSISATARPARSTSRPLAATARRCFSGSARDPTDPGTTTCPALVWAGDKFLVVFGDDRFGNFELTGQFISATATLLGAAIRITTDNSSSTEPAIGLGRRGLRSRMDRSARCQQIGALHTAHACGRDDWRRGHVVRHLGVRRTIGARRSRDRRRDLLVRRFEPKPIPHCDRQFRNRQSATRARLLPTVGTSFTGPARWPGTAARSRPRGSPNRRSRTASSRPARSIPRPAR